MEISLNYKCLIQLNAAQMFRAAKWPIRGLLSKVLHSPLLADSSLRQNSSWSLLAAVQSSTAQYVKGIPTDVSGSSLHLKTAIWDRHTIGWINYRVLATCFVKTETKWPQSHCPWTSMHITPIPWFLNLHQYKIRLKGNFLVSFFVHFSMIIPAL